MFAELHTFDDGTDIETDLCIVGGGPAGIAIAHAFIDTPVRVCLVESGGLKLEAATQALYRGRIVGDPYYQLDASRFRVFGGSTLMWGAQCRPLDAIDFETRDWVPNSGWPFDREALEPYYADAQAFFGLGPYDYRVETWTGKGLSVLPLDPTRVCSRLWHVTSPPVRIGSQYAPALRQAANIRVLLHANAVDIATNSEATRIESIRLKALKGPGATIRARAYILACGGIENARLLLASNSVAPAGLANQYDLVGRYFMEHPHAPLAHNTLQFPIDHFTAYFKNSVPVEGAWVRLKIGLPESVQRRQRLLNSGLHITVGVRGERGPGYLAFKRLAQAAFFRARPDQLGADILTALGDVGGLIGGVYHRLTDPKVLWFSVNSEQVPNPNSRVTLDRDRDALGMPRCRLDWRLTGPEKATARYLCESFGEEMERLGLGRMQMLDWLIEDNDTWQIQEGQYHHMGTTRMDDDPKRGVVDRDGKVHGLANLFVTGSSVFPTSGLANPTLTVVALALRLADHMKRVFT